MNAQGIFAVTMLLAVGLFMFSFVKNKKAYLIKIFCRGVVGVFAIYIINAACFGVEIPLQVGVNYCTICTTAILGVPGLTLLYGISGIKFL